MEPRRKGKTNQPEAVQASPVKELQRSCYRGNPKGQGKRAIKSGASKEPRPPKTLPSELNRAGLLPGKPERSGGESKGKGWREAATPNNDEMDEPMKY